MSVIFITRCYFGLCDFNYYAKCCKNKIEEEKIREEEIRKFGNGQERSRTTSDKKGTVNIGFFTSW